MKDLPPPVRTTDRLLVSERNAPPGFAFPDSFKTSIVGDDLPNLEPMYFLVEFDADGIPDWTEILAGQFPERVLVPFAQDGGTDDIYCFDGNDRSGNPIVLLIHAFTDPG
jgi:hypothetical protein